MLKEGKKGGREEEGRRGGEMEGTSSVVEEGVGDPNGSIVVSVNQAGSGQQTLARSPDPAAVAPCYQRAPSLTVRLLLAFQRHFRMPVVR